MLDLHGGAAQSPANAARFAGEERRPAGVVLSQRDRGLLERQAGRLFQRDSVFGNADVLGERTATAAEYLVPRPEPGDALAHRLDVPSEVSTEPAGLGPDSPASARTMYGVPRMRCQSSGLAEAAFTPTSTSSSPTAGRSMSWSSRTSGEPYR
jgi:hypothetical protein